MGRVRNWFAEKPVRALAAIALGVLAVPIVVGEWYDLDAQVIGSLFDAAGAVLVGVGALWAADRVPASIEHASKVRTERALQFIVDALESARRLRFVASEAKGSKGQSRPLDSRSSLDSLHSNLAATLSRVVNLSDEDARREYEAHAEALHKRVRMLGQALAATPPWDSDWKANVQKAADSLISGCDDLNDALRTDLRGNAP